MRASVATQQRGLVEGRHLKQIARIAAIEDDRPVDVIGRLQVEGQAGQILQAQTAVAVDLGIPEPGLEIRAPAVQRRGGSNVAYRLSRDINVRAVYLVPK